MKTRIDFTVEIAEGDMEALAEVAAAAQRRAIGDFLRYEAQEHLVTYLEGMGVPVTVTRANGARWGE